MIDLRGFIRKNSVSIGITIIVVAMGTILFFQTLALNRLEENLSAQKQVISQVEQVTTAINKKAAERTDQINQLNKHIDCIVLFFTNPDRANTTISDIDTCSLKTSSTGETTNPLGPTGILVPTSPSPQQASSTGSLQPSSSTGMTTPTPQPKPTPPASNPQPTVQPSFLDRNIVQPVKNLLNNIL